MCQLVYVLIGQLLAVHLLYAVGEQTAIEAYEARLRQLAYERGYVLVLHIGVGVVLRARGGVGGLHVVGEELEFLQSLPVLGVLLAVEHERLGGLVEALLHQSLLHLVLDVLHLYVIVYVDVADDPRHGAEVY